MKKIYFFVTLLSIFAAGTATAGSVLILKSTEYNAQPPIVGTVEIATEEDDSRLEIRSISSDESGGLIYSSGREAIIALDHDNKEYYVISQQQIDAIASQFQQAMKQMEEALAKMPPEQREFARQMMKDQMPVQKTITSRGTLSKTGETGSFAGHDCDYYDVLEGQRKIRDICVSPWSAFPEGEEVAGAMQSLGDFFKNMTDAFSSSGGFDLMDTQQDMFSYMKEVGGYPIRTREYDETGDLVRETVLESAKHDEIDPSRFEPPADYQDKPLMQ